MVTLVTGGAGFIGANLVHRLVGDGHTVRVLDDLSTGLESNIQGLPVDFLVGSVEDPQAVADAMAGVDAVVHLAARGSVPRSIHDPIATHSVNVTGTMNVLAAARSEGAYLIFSSSSSVYGANTALPKREEMWTQPLSPYGASKMAAESYVMAFREAYDMDALVLRFFNVYGPLQRPDHDYAAVIPKFVWAGLCGLTLQVHGDGEQTRDFTHVDSVVDVISEALRRRLSWDRPINLAFGDRITVNEVVDVLGSLIPHPLMVEYMPSRAGDVRDSQNDPTLLRSVFPSVESVPFELGMASVVSWLSERV